MEWLTAVRAAIAYIENDLGEATPAEAAARVYMSSLHFQRGFQIMTGYSVSEYIRGRRLYLAALALRTTDRKVIDIAFDYGYDTPESFAKAFTRFHGITPQQVRQGGAIRTFLPLNIRIDIQGGNTMDCRITHMDTIKVIGLAREFEYENAKGGIPRFWDETYARFAALLGGAAPANEVESVFRNCHVGEFGLCVDNGVNGRFTYLIAGRCNGGPVPEGMTVSELPAGDWAVFDCVGPLPATLQALNDRIFREWLPGNPDYELAGDINAEWYSEGDTSASDYHSAVWIPVKRKNA